MTDLIAGIKERRSRAKPYSTGWGMISILSMILSSVPAFLLAFDFLGYHAPGQSPHPGTLTLFLLLGLLLAIVGQGMGDPRNEGIRAPGWIRLIDVLLIRLALAGLVFISSVVKFGLNGRHIPFYPVGVLTLLSAFFIGARLITKFIFHLDHRRSAKV